MEKNIIEYTQKEQIENTLYWLKAIQGLLPEQETLPKECFASSNITVIEDTPRTKVHTYPLTKNYPKRKTTPTITDCITQLAEKGDVFMHTCLHKRYGRKAVDITKNNIDACYMMIVDIDDLPEVNQTGADGKYLMSDEAALEYILNNPRFADVLAIIPPTMILRSGKKGVHLYYVFSSNIKKKERTVEFIHQAFTLLFGADPAVGHLFSTIRVPYAKRGINKNRSEIIGNCEKVYNFDSFFNVVKTICRYTIIREDRSVNFMFNTKSDREYIKDEFTLSDDDFGIDGSMLLYSYLAVQSGVDLKLSEHNHKVKHVKRQCVAINNQIDTIHTADTKRSSLERVKMQKFHANRKHDLLTLAALRKYDVNGCRDLILYNYATNLSLTKADNENIKKETAELNKKFSCPLPESQLNTMLKYVINNRFVVKAKSDMELYQTLQITEDELRYLRNTYSPMQKTEMKKKNAVNQKKIRAKKKMQRIADSISLLFRAIKECGNIKDACEKIKMPLSTAYRRLAEMGKNKDGESRLLRYLKGQLKKAIQHQEFFKLHTLKIYKQKNLYLYDYLRYVLECTMLIQTFKPAPAE